ncbi:hypothetical protein [Natrarchaeobius oligotrophus]|uniref:Uncharacterized protein n=1 Tax=Natrarchaeobius chitinivorans TaxID=1679083 RepID=A0A3N6MQN0_NATCH|nr:hypothetical protein [Natrarchaeobius chitinivorans]RQG96926.1 hypothetical protein EA472_19655 [Natrarchaeobius chitinivorans]
MASTRSQPQPVRELQVLASLIVSIPLAAIVFGGYLQWTGRMASVGALYGLDGLVESWAVHFVHTLLAAMGFVLLVACCRPRRLVSRLGLEGSHWTVFATVLIGGCYGAALWVVAVALGVPLWMEFVLGADRPLPYPHRESFVGLVAFGASFAACYAGLLEYVAADGSDPPHRLEDDRGDGRAS